VVSCKRARQEGPLLPFDKRVVDRQATGASGCLYAVVNLGWFLFFGLDLALSRLLMALLCAVTVIGIPFAAAHVKLAGLVLRPFGREVLRPGAASNCRSIERAGR
jgi:uncharacterized membrane protein YccF (DUF307 family)